MKTASTQILIAAAFVSALAFTNAQAQQYPNPTTAAEVPGPAAGNTMTTEYVQGLADCDDRRQRGDAQDALAADVRAQRIDFGDRVRCCFCHGGGLRYRR
jgi:hypothetical protein